MRGSIFILCYVHLVSGLNFKKFYRNQAIDNKRCESADTVITNENSNEAKCFGLCTSNPRCNSIFVNTDLNLCYGCSRMYTDPSGLPSSPGTEHFEKPVNYGEPCGSDVECNLGPQIGCYGEQCDCHINYHYRNGSCQKGCAAYGSDFKEYKFSELVGPTKKSKWFRPFAAMCTSFCVDNSWCLGFNHDVILAICYYKDSRSFEDPDLAFSLVKHHFMRQCA